MNDQRIDELLEELYAIDPALRAEESSLRKTVEELLRARPEARMDEAFAEELKARLLAEFPKRSAAGEARKRGTRPSLLTRPAARLGLAVAALAAALVAAYVGLAPAARGGARVAALPPKAQPAVAPQYGRASVAPREERPALKLAKREDAAVIDDEIKAESLAPPAGRRGLARARRPRPSTPRATTGSSSPPSPRSSRSPSPPSASTWTRPPTRTSGAS
jgi:hypothetical protein